MGKTYGIKKSLRTHYYKLDWSTNYGETNEKVYLAIKGKINPNPILYLEVRNVSSLWHEAGGKDKIEKISKSEFLKNATGRNIARFYSTLPEYNNLLNYSPELWTQVNDYNFGNDYGKSYRKANKKNSRKSVFSDLKEFKNITNTKVKERTNKEREVR